MPLWTPAQITTARWFDFSNASSVTAIGNAVSQINDLSGNNDHLLQATPASRPAYTLVQQNGLNVATFDGADDSLSFASNFSLGTAHSIFWIGKPSATITTSSPSRTLWSGGSYVWPSTTTSDFLWVSGAVSGNFTNERLTSLVVGYAVGTQDVIGYAKTNADISGAFIASTAFTTSGNSFRGRLNGQDDYATAGVNGGYSSTNTRYPTLLRTLGMRHAFTNAFWSGEVWETVVIPSYLTQQQTEQMEGYLAWKWGVQSSLPANHPYKDVAPIYYDGISDLDALLYIAKVEAADGQALPAYIRTAINNFVVGCKADGTWDAIAACCLMAGPATLNGALIPLKGTAPTNINFVSGDYNSVTGLKGDGATKYLNTNRANNADARDSAHRAVYVTESGGGAYISASSGVIGSDAIFPTVAATYPFRSRTSFAVTGSRSTTSALGFFGINRSVSTSSVSRMYGLNESLADNSNAPTSDNLFVFARSAPLTGHTAARMSFYSIGASLNLALLDLRISEYMSEIAGPYTGIGGEVAWWCPSLDNAGNGTGILNDLTGNANAGTLTNMDPATDWVLDIEKGGTRALEFDGVNDQVVTTAPGITTTDRSTSLWFRTNRSYSNGQYGQMLRWGTASSYPADIGKDWQVIIGTDFNLGTNAVGISQYGDAVGATGFNDGKWHHLYVEARGSVYSVYVDGVFRASKTMTTNATAGTITIGSSFSLPYRDYLDDIRVFNRALSVSEISTLASRRGTGRYLWTAERITAKAWYDASDRLTIFNSWSGGSLPADNQAVGRWQDKSGNGKHLVQASSNPQPLRRTAVQNGLDAIRFDDTDDRLQDSGAASYWTFLHASTSSVFYVAKVNVSNPGGLGFPKDLCSFFGTFDTSFSNRGWITYLDDRSASGANNRIVSSTGPGNGLGSTAGVSVNDGFPTLQANIVASFGDMQNATISNRISQKVNGGASVAGSFGTQSASSSAPTHSLRVGMVWDSQWAMNGDMYEIIIIEGIVSDLVRDQIEGYLAWKWGIQSLLPSDHPYKNAAPIVQLGGRRRRNIGNHGL